jgi:transcriptional regulator with XRE-family HTH domain
MLLQERDISLSDIARRFGRSLSFVSRVNNGQRRSQTIEREIARRLGLSEEEAFPEWHDRRSKTSRKDTKR